MKVMICIGSSCHIKGSSQVVELMQKAVREHRLEDKAELGGTFPCFFETEILAKCI